MPSKGNVITTITITENGEDYVTEEVVEIVPDSTIAKDSAQSTISSPNPCEEPPKGINDAPVNKDNIIDGPKTLENTKKKTPRPRKSPVTSNKDTKSQSASVPSNQTKVNVTPPKALLTPHKTGSAKQKISSSSSNTISPKPVTPSKQRTLGSFFFKTPPKKSTTAPKLTSSGAKPSLETPSISTNGKNTKSEPPVLIRKFPSTTAISSTMPETTTKQDDTPISILTPPPTSVSATSTKTRRADKTKTVKQLYSPQKNTPSKEDLMAIVLGPHFGKETVLSSLKKSPPRKMKNNIKALLPELVKYDNDDFMSGPKVKKRRSSSAKAKKDVAAKKTVESDGNESPTVPKDYNSKNTEKKHSSISTPATNKASLSEINVSSSDSEALKDCVETKHMSVNETCGRMDYDVKMQSRQESKNNAVEDKPTTSEITKVDEGESSMRKGRDEKTPSRQHPKSNADIGELSTTEKTKTLSEDIISKDTNNENETACAITILFPRKKSKVNKAQNHHTDEKSIQKFHNLSLTESPITESPNISSPQTEVQVLQSHRRPKKGELNSVSTSQMIAEVQKESDIAEDKHEKKNACKVEDLEKVALNQPRKWSKNEFSEENLIAATAVEQKVTKTSKANFLQARKRKKEDSNSISAESKDKIILNKDTENDDGGFSVKKSHLPHDDKKPMNGETLTNFLNKQPVQEKIANAKTGDCAKNQVPIANILRPRKKIKDTSAGNDGKENEVNAIKAKSDESVAQNLASKDCAINELESIKGVKLSTNSSLPTTISKSSPKVKFTTPKKDVAAKKIEEQKLEETNHELSSEAKALLSKHDTLRTRYRTRAEEVVQRAVDGELNEEDFQEEDCEKEKETENSFTNTNDESITEFRDEWVPDLAIIVQGSPLSVNRLAMKARSKILSKLNAEDNILSLDAVATKIKLIASRKQYLLPMPPASSSNTNIDIYSNVDAKLLWRWELISLDLLPKAKVLTVKKARTARRKLQSYQKAIHRLLLALDDGDAHVMSLSPNQNKKDAILAKISSEEEKVLKFEREEEKNRLLQDSKLQKEKERALKQEEKQKEKERIEEEKRKEKIQREEEKERKKRLAEELKQKKVDQTAREKEQKAKKQKARMMSFFKTTPSTPLSRSSPTILSTEVSICDLTSNSTGGESIISDKPPLDSDRFWSLIGSSDAFETPTFPELSSRAVSSRRRRTRKVNVKVYVTLVSDNPFERQPYDEERVIQIRNKYKYLSFHEDHRPPYYGSWSKPVSSFVTGRKPFGKDEYLDYEVDSEAEWEEDDEEEGEDCSENNDDDEIDDDEGDTRVYNYQDGWLTYDDDMGLENDEDNDEETRIMRKKRLEASSGHVNGSKTELGPKPSTACVIAPLMGGIPQMSDEETCPSLISELLYGIDTSEANNLFLSHTGEILDSTVNVCLDTFPPCEETDKVAADSDAGLSTNKASCQEMSQDKMKTFVKFVHNCTLNSRDKVVEELRSAHKDITSSRAQAVRKLHSVATKRKDLKSGKGVIWEVKNEVLESLGLEELIKKPDTEEVNNNKAPIEKDTKTKANERAESTASQALSIPTPVSPQSEPKIKDDSTELKLNKKRKYPQVSKASANLLASFLQRKKTALEP